MYLFYFSAYNVVNFYYFLIKGELKLDLLTFVSSCRLCNYSLEFVPEREKYQKYLNYTIKILKLNE